MTTGGEGGMVTTNDRTLWSAMWSYKDHGKSWDAVYGREHPPGFRWVHESFGTNWRMLEMQAVIGRIQLKRMADWTRRRTEVGRQIEATCQRFSGLRVPSKPIEIVHAYYKLYVFIQPAYLAAGWTRDRIIDEIVALGVPCYQGSCSEVYLEKAFEGTGFVPVDRLPVAKLLGDISLMFLVHPTLTDVEIETTCRVAESVFLRAFVS